jgi:hypothetical protein
MGGGMSIIETMICPEPQVPFPSQDELRPRLDPETGIDLSLIEENLKLTPWERVLANDDTINFIDMARAALNQNYAAS